VLVARFYPAGPGTAIALRYARCCGAAAVGAGGGLH